MAPEEDPSPSSAYILSYRNAEPDEHRRLDVQHDVITHAILAGNVVHPAVRIPDRRVKVADVACGTGVWLEGVRGWLGASASESSSSSQSEYSGDSEAGGKEESKRETPLLVGFDVNEHAFDTRLSPAVTFVRHDCAEAFPAAYIGAFDLVNMRGLAFAVPETKFVALLRNAVSLLRPGGYLQWLETDTRLFRQVPSDAEFEAVLELLNEERPKRGLVMDLPHFMLRETLRFSSPPTTAPPSPSPSLEILHFNLLPGGICRDERRTDDALNKRFSETVLESLRAALAGLLVQGGGEDGGEDGGEGRMEKIGRLARVVERRKEGEEVLAGGVFPQLVARRAGM